MAAKTILIGDDDAGIRQLVTVFLEPFGYPASSVCTGAEARTYREHTSPRPQLILLDVMMPVMHGAAFRSARQLRCLLLGRAVVVLAAAENDQTQALLPTADASLPKPIDFDALRTHVEQYCSQNRASGRWYAEASRA